jgi:hypothetical protein
VQQQRGGVPAAGPGGQAAPAGAAGAAGAAALGNHPMMAELRQASCLYLSGHRLRTDHYLGAIYSLFSKTPP